MSSKGGKPGIDAFAASEMPVGRIYDRVLALTRSGTTTEVVDVLKRTTLPTTVVTGDPDAPAAGLAHHAVLMPFAD